MDTFSGAGRQIRHIYCLMQDVYVSIGDSYRSTQTCREISHAICLQNKLGFTVLHKHP